MAERKHPDIRDLKPAILVRVEELRKLLTLIKLAGMIRRQDRGDKEDTA